MNGIINDLEIEVAPRIKNLKQKIEVVTNYNRLESLMLSPTELKIEVVIKENQK